MFKHSLLLIFRNFKRFKSTFFINLIGLSAGLVCVLLIYLWVNDELGVDRFFENDDRIFQVMQNTKADAGIQTMEATPALLAKALASEMPEVEYSLSVVPPSFNISKGILSIGDTHIKASGQYVSQNFFHVFSYKLIMGDRQNALSDKKNIVISDQLALKLFKSREEALGKTIAWSAQEIEELCVISGVFESPPSQATRQFDLVLNYSLFEQVNPPNGWANSSPHTYLFLKEGVSANQFNARIRDFIKQKDNSSHATLFIQRYSDRYLYGQYENGMPAGGRIEYVKIFSLTGIFILVIACINFMNLSTARSLRKMKEVGIKKTLGANRKTLILQYLVESMSMALLSLMVAVLVADLMMSSFNSITGKNLHLSFDLTLVAGILSITVFTGLVSGSYPAFYLSGFKAANVLKGNMSFGIREAVTRKGLVIFQFAVSVILIIAVAVVYKQMEFVQTKNLGYDRNNVLYFNASGMTTAVMSEIKGIPGVINAGGGRLLAGNRLGGTNDLQWEGKSLEEDLFINNLWMSFGLIETLDMEMAEGHPFIENPGSGNEIIFNEEAIRRMNLKNPLGKKTKIGGEEKQIIGIVKDFHFESLYEKVKPCALLIAPMEYAPSISVKIQAGAEQLTINQLQHVLKAHYPGEPFDFKFMDEDYQKLYAAEQRVSTLTKYFAAIAIIISCMGLFGLAAFTAERRRKEIGIRKVLGSTSTGIVYLLSGDFSKTVLISLLISLPVSYWLTSNWLNGFAFKIQLEWWYFISTGLITLVIAWITVSTQAIRAALANPTESLKEE